MQIQFQLSLEDLSEFFAVQQATKPKFSSFLKWLLFLGAMIGCFVAIGMFRNRGGSSIPSAPTEPGNDPPIMGYLKLMSIIVSLWIVYLHHIQFHFRFNPKNPKTKVSPIILTGLIILTFVMVGGVLLFMNQHDREHSTTTPIYQISDYAKSGLPFLGILTLIWIGYFWYTRAFKKHQQTLIDQQKPQTYEFAPDKIINTTQHITIEYQWPAFTQHHESKTLFLLYLNSSSALIIPKRAFSPPTDLDTFRNLIQSKLHTPTPPH